MAKKKVIKKKTVKAKVKTSSSMTIATDESNTIEVYVKKHARFVSGILEARKKDISHVFALRRAIIDVETDEKLKPETKETKLSELKAQLKQAKIDAKLSQKAIEKTVDDAIKNNFYDLRVCFSYQQVKYQDYLDELNKLRRDGENKIIALRNEIQDIILNKQIEKHEKRELIDNNIKELKKARENAKLMKKEVKAVLHEAMVLSKLDSKQYMRLVKAGNKYDNNLSRTQYKDMCKTINEMHTKRVIQLKSEAKDKKALAVDLKAENIAYSSKLNEAKTAKVEAIDRSKELRYSSFMNKYAYTGKLKHDHHPIGEWFRFKYENYIANFNLQNWLLKNALYVVILVVFAALVGMTGGGLLKGESLLGALVQISPKIFFALGVAGLILLGGTDLSIGRLTGVGVSFTLMILSNDIYPDINGNAWWIFTTAPGAVKIITALLISILLCTFFTTFAGFFTAKFKMHPFISTLAVQLISYGFFQIFWSATSSFSPDTDLLAALRGPQSILLVIYAIIAILIVWFIWNKTKFGKHMYAVGGNQEAATVSGISPFKITMLAFVMAGILYGFGGFVQAIQTGTGNFNSGYGTETDAIAACVIGGISFSGGVGKVGGAVIGAIILGFLTYAFAYIGVNSNLQLLIKGVIILIAVALDCVKYLRKK
ncbi:MAG: galactoside ABC transporter permease [Bacilli bacterium]|nr:galactoside ABC transporter permease [Bacilli bacterium]